VELFYREERLKVSALTTDFKLNKIHNTCLLI